jgi:hypothetical protein
MIRKIRSLQSLRYRFHVSILHAVINLILLKLIPFFIQQNTTVHTLILVTKYMNGDHALRCLNDKCVCKVRGGVGVLHEPYGKPVLAPKNADIGPFVDKTCGGGGRQ